MRKTNNVIKIKDFKVDKGLPFDQEYNFAYLDENTKKMIRRAIIKALCIPGYQVPLPLEKCLCHMDGEQVESKLLRAA